MPSDKQMPRAIPRTGDIIWKIESRRHARIYEIENGLMTTVDATGCLFKLSVDSEGVAWTWLKPASGSA